MSGAPTGLGTRGDRGEPARPRGEPARAPGPRGGGRPRSAVRPAPEGAQSTRRFARAARRREARGGGKILLPRGGPPHGHTAAPERGLDSTLYATISLLY